MLGTLGERHADARSVMTPSINAMTGKLWKYCGNAVNLENFFTCRYRYGRK